MTNKKLGAIWASSSNPEEISNRVKGIVLALSSIIILVAAQFFKIQLSAGDVVSLATQLGTVAGLVWSLYGGVLALIRFFGSKTV